MEDETIVFRIIFSKINHIISGSELNKKLLRLCNIDYLTFQTLFPFDEGSGSGDTDDDLEELQRLLAAGADINITNTRTNETCLIHAAHLGDYEMTKILLENGAATDLKDFIGYSALLKASIGAYDKIEKLLLKHGATPLDDNEKKLIEDQLKQDINYV